MKDKEAMEVLRKMPDNSSFSAKEKEAISAAIGILGWTSLAESKIKERKAKKEKDLEWK
jgi:hypothetical protein